jgi:hypothetical protein
MGFNKCEFEPNIQCDREYKCLDCIKQENIWAENWIKGTKEKFEKETERLEETLTIVEPKETR